MAPERSPELRASDADREAVAQRLRGAAADGRLELQEAEQRLAAAYTARTYGELEPLIADLGPDPHASAIAVRRAWTREWREWAGIAVILNAIWAITCLAAGELLFYWPMFPVGIWGAILLAQTVFGGGDDDDERHRTRDASGRERAIDPHDEPRDRSLGSG